MIANPLTELSIDCCVSSAAAKVQRVLPEALRWRLDALMHTTDFTVRSSPVAELQTVVLLLVAEAARDRRPVELRYTASDGRRSERTVHPYGLVAHSGRWYVTGADSASGDIRTFRLDRIMAAELQTGTFDLPDGFDPTEQVLSGLAEAPRRHAVSLRVQGKAEQVRSRLPAEIASVRDIPALDGWVRVRLRVERLDWVPGVLASLALPFAVEHPDALRGLLRGLADRLTAAADADTIHNDESTSEDDLDRGDIVDNAVDAERRTTR